MLAPLVKLEGAKIERASHTAEQDSLRVGFAGGIVAIFYNDSFINDVRLSIADPTCDYLDIVGLSVESIDAAGARVSFRLTGGIELAVGLSALDAHGPEAFQLVIPGYCRSERIARTPELTILVGVAATDPHGRCAARSSQPEVLLQTLRRAQGP